MSGGLWKIVDGDYIETFCEYSVNGKCKACNILSIACDGERYWLCAQRDLVKSKKEEEKVKQ